MRKIINEKTIIKLKGVNFAAIIMLVASVLTILALSIALGDIIFDDGIAIPIFMPFIILIIIAIVMLCYPEYLIITDKRAYKASWFDSIKVIPLEKITSYQTGGFLKAIRIKSASGVVSVVFCGDYLKARGVLDELTSVQEKEIPSQNSEAITQE